MEASKTKGVAEIEQPLFAHENKGNAFVFPRGRLDYDEIQIELTVHLSCTLQSYRNAMSLQSALQKNPILQ
jgi:hypothetical protein